MGQGEMRRFETGECAFLRCWRMGTFAKRGTFAVRGQGFIYLKIES